MAKDKEEIVKNWAEDLNEAVAAELWNFPYPYHPSNFSDICDKNGNYYVDLVLGGGGMLGVVHAGFIHALEESDLKFRAVAGSSAGSLSAALLVAQKPDVKWKGLTLGAILASLDGDELLDNWQAKFLFRWQFKWKLPGIILVSIIIASNRFFRRGLISGDRFQTKLEEVLRKLSDPDASATKDGDQLLTNLPELDLYHATGEDDAENLDRVKLVVVASDITTETKLELPLSEALFDHEGADPIPIYVRASSSVPVVFEPVPMKLQRPFIKQRHRDYYENRKFEAIDVVDGGLMSNFPIGVFHRKPDLNTPAAAAGLFRTPRLPTIGVQLRPLEEVANRTKGVFRYIWSLAASMLDVGDEDFIRRHPDYRSVVRIVDVSDVEPFNLFLEKEKKIELFVRGYRTGKEFLDTFNWHEYKQLRKTLAREEDIY